MTDAITVTDADREAAKNIAEYMWDCRLQPEHVAKVRSIIAGAMSPERARTERMEAAFKEFLVECESIAHHVLRRDGGGHLDLIAAAKKARAALGENAK